MRMVLYLLYLGEICCNDKGTEGVARFSIISRLCLSFKPGRPFHSYRFSENLEWRLLLLDLALLCIESSTGGFKDDIIRLIESQDPCGVPGIKLVEGINDICESSTKIAVDLDNFTKFLCISA